MRVSIILAAAAAPLFALQLQGCSRAMADSDSAKSKPVDRTVELTIYPDDFTLVHEVRPVSLQNGSQKLQLTEVSKQLDPRSVMLDWPNNSDLPAPISNSYDLGVNNDSDLMKRYLGQDVEVVRYNQNGSVSERDKGKLMVASPGQTVIQTGDKFLINPPGSIEAPTQSDIVTIPQLSVQVESPKVEQADLNLSYLTRGLSWATDYVAQLLPSDDAISLQCWATVTNKTGTTFPNAKVTLMAGQPNRAALNARARTPMAAESIDGEAMLAEGVRGYADAVGNDFTLAKHAAMKAPEAVGDLQAYDVVKPADIVQDQMNRLMLLSSEKVPIEKEYRAVLPVLTSYGYVDYDYDYYGQRDNPRGVVTMAFHFKNDPKSGLGAPLPAGILRVYGKDQSGSNRYLGAANVWNAPKDAKVDVTLANAFDLYTMRRITATKKMSKHTIRKTVEITVHNAKSADADVLVLQNFGGKFKIVDESIKHESPDASSARWKVHVPAGKDTVLKFSVDLSD